MELNRSTLMTRRTDGRRSEGGFALVLAILTLLMLTFLGLSLALTTSTELQISNNFKWGQQAYHNAEGGLELAKRLLLKQAWSALLPPARTSAQMTVGSAMPTWTLNRPDIGGNATRNWENKDCDIVQGYQGVGNGVVLDHQNFTLPFQNTSTYYTAGLNGAFTVWVRRTILVNVDGSVQDDPADRLVITVEGTAPFANAASTGAYATRSRAVRVIQAELSMVDPDCENDFAGQSGLSALNPNYDPCSKLNAKGVPTGTVGKVVTEINKNQ
jgi:hypothetical protein